MAEEPGHTLEDFIFWRRIKIDAKWHKSARFQLLSADETEQLLDDLPSIRKIFIVVAVDAGPRVPPVPLSLANLGRLESHPRS